MTLRQLYEAMLIEQSKVSSPSMLLKDFNHFANKAVNNYINKRYSFYDMNQLTTDDLRVLSTTAECDVVYNEKTGFYEFELPSDYLHLLNCICAFTMNNSDGTCHEGQEYQYAAKRITADSWTIIMEDYYNRPTYYRPYYYIHNVNSYPLVSTNPYSEVEETDEGTESGTDMNENKYTTSGTKVTNSNLRRVIKLNSGKTIDTVEKETAFRYGNASKVRCEIRCGNTSNYSLKCVYVDYIKSPQHLNLTQQQISLTADTSLILEFPDYVCIEILNELKIIVLENTADPRLQTSAAVSLTIGSIAQQLSTQTPSSSSALES